MSKPFKSITGVIVNDPNICVKGTNFGCLCAACKNERNDFMSRLQIVLDLPPHQGEQFWQKVKEVRDNFYSEGDAVDYCMEGFGLLSVKKK